MSYEVLARKFRPQNLSELAGQDSIRQTLSNALKKNRLYPVLLFAGPRGTGKTSSARILAKILRCFHKKDLIPCNQCKDCLLIQESRHLDVIEIDGASNTGVDSIRELKDSLSYMPTAGRWKIYIIDEVHMLSNSAFNALLKTLEEPPAHIIFILATTEIHKIPTTVLSRAQRLDFHTLPPKLIKNRLELICKKESINISEEILWTIARQAQGSLRDAQSLLDQLHTFSGGEALSTEEASRQLGLSDPLLTKKALHALVQGQEREMALLIEELRIKGTEPKIFLQSLLEGISRFLFLKKNPENKPELVYVSKEEIREIKKEIQEIAYENLHFLFDMLLKGERELAFCHDSRLALEILLLRATAAPRLESLIPFNPLKEIKNIPPSTAGALKKTELTESKSLKPTTTDRPSKSAQAQTQKPAEEEEKATKKELMAKALKPKPSSPAPAASASSSSAPAASAFTPSSAAAASSSSSVSSAENPPPLEKTSESELKSESETELKSEPQPEPKESEQRASFAQRQDFFEFLKSKDSKLADLAGSLRIEKRGGGVFCFSAPTSFSWLKKKISEPHTQRLFTAHLTDFLQLTEKAKTEFVTEKTHLPSLREENKALEESQNLKQIQQDPFVKEVKDLFQAKT